MSVRAFAIVGGLTVIAIMSMEERYSRTGTGRFMLDHSKTADLSVADRFQNVPGVTHVALNVMSKETNRPTDKRVGIVFSKRSGIKKEVFIKGLNVKISSTDLIDQESIVYTTGGNGQPGLSCVRDIIDGQKTRPQCRPLDEKDMKWVLEVAARVGYTQDFVAARLPYEEPVKSKISGAVWQQAWRNQRREEYRLKNGN